MMLRKTLASLAVLTWVTGCGSLSVEGKKIDYKTSGKVPSLEVPPDLMAPSTENRFVVPENKPGSATFSAYSKDRSGTAAASGVVLPVVSQASMERAGTQRWLVVRAAPEQLWPSVKDFWQDLGFIVRTESPDAGYMETEWAENRAKIPQDMIRNTVGKVFDSLYSTAERDKFRTRFERGITPGTTEIYISHRGMVEVLRGGDGGDTTIWQPRPADPELEAEMLQRLLLKLGSPENKTQGQGVNPVVVERAKLDALGGVTVIDPFDRAWRRVGLALDRIGFTVVDRDRSRGVYFVRYVDPGMDAVKQEKKAWLSRLSFWSSDAGKAAKLEQYRILIQELPGGTSSQLQVLDKEGQPDRSDTAGRILRLLHEQLK